MATRLLGLETEYAFSVVDGARVADEGDSPSRPRSVRALINAARLLAPHLSNGPIDLFFPFGRFYIDCGAHPEFATAECTNPGELLRMVLTGERLLTQASEALARESGDGDVILTRCNVDYSPSSDATWGCHESYLHSANRNSMSKEIIPHLVSRQIYTGAGGFDSSTPGSQPLFMVSPRVAHLEKVLSNNSTAERGIFHTKNESLCGSRYSRLHLLCGESLCSQTSSWLKVGTTAVVVALIEAGLSPGSDVQLREPLEAMNAFARDPRCTATAAMEDGRRLRAIGIQRHYLEVAETNANHDAMPPWTLEVCRRWRAILDRLEDGAPESVCTTLDWGIKWGLMRAHAERRGLPWDRLSRCSPKAIAQVRPELFEIDVRFGQLGPRGIFSALDAAGVLDHRIDGIEAGDPNVEAPSTGRASLRARLIREFAGVPQRYLCTWEHVYDHTQRRVVSLQDPFATEMEWTAMPTPSEGKPRRRDASEILSRMARRLGRRRPSQLRIRIGTHVIATHVLPGTVELVRVPAVVTNVERDSDGIVYRLDIDEGAAAWRGPQLRLVDPSPDALLPF